MAEDAPSTLDQVAERIRAANADKRPLNIAGTTARRALGREDRSGDLLSLARLRSIVSYEPSELVLVCDAGAPLDDIEATLAEKGQMLAFEPPDARRLLGAAGAGTIGGAVAVGLGGPRRVFAGAPRDFVLGVKGVTGAGDVFKAGGRVVKNVTGFDIARLTAGSFGTLAVLTEIALKVLPIPAASHTLLVQTNSAADALTALAAARRSNADPSGLAYLPAQGEAAIRIEGSKAGVAERTAHVKTLLGGGARDIEGEESLSLWRDIRDAAPLTPTHLAAAPLWRTSLPPADAAAFLGVTNGEAILVDWGGGLVWTAARRPPQAPIASWMRVRAGDTSGLPAFSSLDPGVVALSRRIKQAFDPEIILNPRRLFEEF